MDAPGAATESSQCAPIDGAVPIDQKKKKIKKKVSMFAELPDDTASTIEHDGMMKNSLSIDVLNGDIGIRTAEVDNNATLEVNVTQTTSTTPRITPRTSPKGTNNNHNTNFDNENDTNNNEFNSVLELSSSSNQVNNNIALTNSQYRRYERISRRASIAMDICTGIEMYRVDSIRFTYFLTLALPIFTLFIVFGMIPYYFSYWIRLFLPFTSIFLVTAILIFEIYSSVISEVEFGIVIFDAFDNSDGENDNVLILLGKVYGLTLIPLFAIILTLYYCLYDQQHDMSQLYWLLILNTCSILTIFGLITFSYLPKREISRVMSSKSNQTSQSDALKSERKQQNHSAILWALGTLVMFNIVPTIYVILSNIYRAYQRHTDGFVGYVMAILIAISPKLYIYILNNVLQFGNKKGYLCCSQVVSTFVYTLHIAFLVLVGSSISTYGELVVIGVIQVLILTSYSRSCTICNFHQRIGVILNSDSGRYSVPESNEDSHIKLVDELLCISQILTTGAILPIASLIISSFLCAGPNYVLFNDADNISIHEYIRAPYVNWVKPSRLYSHSYVDGNAYIVKLVLMSVFHAILITLFRQYYKKYYDIEILGAVSAYTQDYFVQMICCTVYSCLIIFATSFDWFYI